MKHAHAFKPVKPRPYGSVAHVVSETIRAAGPIKRLAHDAKVSLGRMYQYAGDDAERTPFGVICQFVRNGATAPVEFLAALAGGCFLPGRASEESLTALAAKSAIEHAEFVGRVLSHCNERPRSALNALEILKELDDAIRLLVAARARVLDDVEARR